jgi:hypothetical protein
VPLGRGRDRSRARGGAGGAQPFTPGALAPFAWVRGDLGVTLNGSNISAWADQGAAPAQDLTEATAANQAPYVASDAAFGGRPIMSTGANTKGVQASTAADWNFCHNGTGMTLFMVARSRGPAGNFMLGTQSSAGVVGLGFSCIFWTTNNLRFVVGAGAAGVIDVATTGNTFPAAAAHVVVITYRTGSDPDCVIRIDRAQVGTGSEAVAPSASNAMGPLSLGYPINKAGGCDSDFADFALFNRVLSAAEITQLETYAARYGI